MRENLELNLADTEKLLHLAKEIASKAYNAGRANAEFDAETQI